MTLPAPLTSAAPADVLVTLDSYAWLRISGVDARDFLQGQLSSDVRETSLIHAQITSHSSAKGRVLFTGTLIAPQAQAYLLELPREMLDEAQQRLRRFVLRAKLSIDALGHDFAALGLIGPSAPAALHAAGLPIPESDWAVVAGSAQLVLRKPGLPLRYVVYGGRADLEALKAPLGAVLRAGSAEDWHLAEVLAGIPSVLMATRERFVAQMLNLDQLGGIGLNKGCYTGQEVIARVHYLGTLKRRMALAWSAHAAAPGQSVVNDGGDSQVVGEVVDCAAIPTGGYAVQLVLQTTALDAALRLDGNMESLLQLAAPAKSINRE